MTCFSLHVGVAAGLVCSTCEHSAQCAALDNRDAGAQAIRHGEMASELSDFSSAQFAAESQHGGTDMPPQSSHSDPNATQHSPPEPGILGAVGAHSGNALWTRSSIACWAAIWLSFVGSVAWALKTQDLWPLSLWVVLGSASALAAP